MNVKIYSIQQVRGTCNVEDHHKRAVQMQDISLVHLNFKFLDLASSQQTTSSLHAGKVSFIGSCLIIIEEHITSINDLFSY